MAALEAVGLPTTRPKLEATRDEQPPPRADVDEEMPERADSPWSAACTHMSESDGEQVIRSPPGGGGYLAEYLEGRSDNSLSARWSPACTRGTNRS